jgi:microcystin-dependent protein
MPEEVSPESKLYVKEEIEKTRKDIREEVEKVNSRATKTFTTVALVVGLLTGLGVYGLAKDYIDTSIKKEIGEDTLAKIRKYEDEAENSYKQIVQYEYKAEKILSGRPIIGTIVPYGGEIVETKPGDPYQVQLGWFFCNGASLDREEYKDLFDVIGVAFGAPDPNTFNLPDLRGRFVRGVDHGAGNDPDARLREAGNKGGNTGNKVGSVQDDELKKHKHQWQGFRACDSGSRAVRSRDPIKSDSIQDACFETGGNETRPKNVYVDWIIRAR